MERAASSQDPDPPAAGLAGARAAGGRRIRSARIHERTETSRTSVPLPSTTKSLRSVSASANASG